MVEKNKTTRWHLHVEMSQSKSSLWTPNPPPLLVPKLNMGSALLLCALLLVLCTNTSAFNTIISTHSTNSRLINASGHKIQQHTDIASSFHHTVVNFTQKRTIFRTSYTRMKATPSYGMNPTIYPETNSIPPSIRESFPGPVPQIPGPTVYKQGTAIDIMNDDKSE